MAATVDTRGPLYPGSSSAGFGKEGSYSNNGKLEKWGDELLGPRDSGVRLELDLIPWSSH